MARLALAAILAISCIAAIVIETLAQQPPSEVINYIAIISAAYIVGAAARAKPPK